MWRYFHNDAYLEQFPTCRTHPHMFIQDTKVYGLRLAAVFMLCIDKRGTTADEAICTDCSENIYRSDHRESQVAWIIKPCTNTSVHTPQRTTKWSPPVWARAQPSRISTCDLRIGTCALAYDYFVSRVILYQRIFARAPNDRIVGTAAVTTGQGVSLGKQLRIGGIQRGNSWARGVHPSRRCKYITPIQDSKVQNTWQTSQAYPAKCTAWD